MVWRWLIPFVFVVNVIVAATLSPTGIHNFESTFSEIRNKCELILKAGCRYLLVVTLVVIPFFSPVRFSQDGYRSPMNTFIHHNEPTVARHQALFRTIN